MLLVGTQMKYLVITKQVGRERCMWMISKQLITIGQLCGTRNTMENCYFLSILHPCCIVCWQVGGSGSFWTRGSQLASYNARAMSYTLDEWGGSLCLQRTHKHETILFDCVCRQRSLCLHRQSAMDHSIHSSVHYIY